MQIVHINQNGNTTHQAQAAGWTHQNFARIIQTGFILITGLGFWYLILLNTLATTTFSLEELKAERIEIQKTLQTWEIATAIPTSLYALESSEQVQRMEKVTKKHFIHIRNKTPKLAFLH